MSTSKSLEGAGEPREKAVSNQASGVAVPPPTAGDTLAGQAPAWPFDSAWLGGLVGLLVLAGGPSIAIFFAIGFGIDFFYEVAFAGFGGILLLALFTGAQGRRRFSFGLVLSMGVLFLIGVGTCGFLQLFQ